MTEAENDRRKARSATRVALPALAALLTSGLVVFALSAQSTGSQPDTKDGKVHTVNGGKLPTDRPKLRASRAPLSPEEVGYATQLAITANSLPPGMTDVHGEPGPQFLYSDLPRIAEADGNKRLAMVMLYDYTSDRAYQVLVDLTSKQADAADSAPNLQPPPAADEADAALQIALETSVRLNFRQEFEALNGIPLLSPDQVSYKAGTWLYDETTPDGKECGTHRCLQLIVRDSSGAYLDTRDFVVDLTSKSIVKPRGGK